jgi:hypothetical protein
MLVTAGCAGGEPSDAAVVWWHAGVAALPSPAGYGGWQSATNFGDEIGRQRDKCLITRSEKRRFPVFMPTRGRAGPLRRMEKRLRHQPGLELQVGKTPWCRGDCESELKMEIPA